MNDKISSTRGVDKFLVILGYCLIGVGTIVAFALAADVYTYNFRWGIFIVTLLSTYFGGGIFIGLGEIISRLDYMNKVTQATEEMNMKMSDILQYQQGILDAILEEQNNHKILKS